MRDLDRLVAMAMVRVARQFQHADLEDIQAVVMARVWRAVQAIDPKVADPRAYLQQAAKHDVIDEARKRRQAPTPKPLPSTMPARKDPLRAVDDADEVETLLARMTLRQREVMRRHFLEGQSHRDIAQDLKLSRSRVESAVRSAKTRARTGRPTH